MMKSRKRGKPRKQNTVCYKQNGDNIEQEYMLKVLSM